MISDLKKKKINKLKSLIPANSLPSPGTRKSSQMYLMIAINRYLLYIIGAIEVERNYDCKLVKSIYK